MEVEIGEVCIPGDRLADLESYDEGYGTYSRHGYIFASLLGVVQTEKTKDLKKKSIVSVKPKRKAQAIPEIGSIVTCKITLTTSRFARCHIIAINEDQLSDPLRGLIRREDVRSTDRDKVQMHKCLLPGDLVVAKVLSLGDSIYYLLSTSEPELGVVIATSKAAGANMIPLSHCEMQCPISSQKEARKVARPQIEHITLPKEKN